MANVDSLIPFQPTIPPAHHVVAPLTSAPPVTPDTLGWLSNWNPPVFTPSRIDRVHITEPPWMEPIYLSYTELPRGFQELTYRRFDYKTAQVLTGLTIGPLTTPVTPPVVIECALTVADFKTRLGEMLDDPSLIYYTPEEVLHVLNMSERLFCLLTMCLEKNASFALTNGQAFYNDIRAQIQDFLLPLRVYHSGSRLVADTIHNLDLRDSTWRTRAGDPKKYAVAGIKLLAVTPQPASGVHTLDVWYAAEPAAMTQESDSPRIAPEQHVHLQDCSYWLLRLKEGGAEHAAAKPYLDRFLAGVAKYNAFVGSKSRGQLYDTPPFDLASFDRGRFELKLKKIMEAQQQRRKGPST